MSFEVSLKGGPIPQRRVIRVPFFFWLGFSIGHSVKEA